MEKFTRTNSIVDAELAGCLPELNNGANFNNMITTLEQHLSLCYSRTRAADLVAIVQRETHTILLPFHEYVINELQYERRLAISGADKISPDYEQAILSKWSRSLILKYGSEYTMHFFTALSANRLKRSR
jgi:hypothetical protein